MTQASGQPAMEEMLAHVIYSREALLGTPRVTAMLLELFATVALFITIVGVVGTLALFVARRNKDIGIRMALGATQETILRYFLYCGMVPVLTGMAIGV